MSALRPLALALATAALAVPAIAAQGPAHYRAELAAPAEKARIVAGEELPADELARCNG